MEKRIPYWVDNGNGELVEVFVTQEVYDILDEGRRETARYAKEFERHGSEHEVEDEYVIAQHWQTHDTELDEILYSFEMERVKDILSKYCTEKQRKRFILNRIEGYSIQEIAILSNCNESSIKRSLASAEKILKKFF